MAKFNIGDKVRVRRDLIPGTNYNGLYLDSLTKNYVGDEGVITEVYDDSYAMDTNEFCWTEEMLEKITEENEDLETKTPAKNKYIRTTLYMRLPEGCVESDVDLAIAEVLKRFGGYLIESTEYREDNLYSDDDFDSDTNYSSYSNDSFYC